MGRLLLINFYFTRGRYVSSEKRDEKPLLEEHVSLKKKERQSRLSRSPTGDLSLTSIARGTMLFLDAFA